MSTAAFVAHPAEAQVGRRFPSERRVVPDPVTGIPVTFLTSTPAGDSKIYPTHPQWTADGQWVVFRSDRVKGQAMAVHEADGTIVQLTEKGYTGALCVGQNAMKLWFNRDLGTREAPGPVQIVEVDLAALLRDSAAGKMRPEGYERVVGTLPSDWRGHGELAIDELAHLAYFRITGGDVGQYLVPGTPIEPDFGPRGMGEGPSGLRQMDLVTGEVSTICDVPFQIGHVQHNPFVAGEVIFCWETGGKAPTRMWVVQGDGTGLRPIYAETAYDWVTHEIVATADEVIFAMMGHRPMGTTDAWGPAGTRRHPTGMVAANLRTGETQLISQTREGSGFWHVTASPDGRLAAGDDFARNLWLVDRQTGETMLWSTGHKETAADHVHPTFSPCGTKVNIQSAQLSEDNRSMNIAVVPVPTSWLQRPLPKRPQP